MELGRDNLAIFVRLRSGQSMQQYNIPTLHIAKISQALFAAN
jgi:hypothetical protein